jgi:hypothetical protein
MIILGASEQDYHTGFCDIKALYELIRELQVKHQLLSLDLSEGGRENLLPSLTG